MKWPYISIIIATYNSKRLLDKCLQSIRTQDYPQDLIEIILVDAGSTDSTLNIGKRHDCRILRKPGINSEAAKAYGLKEAKGKFIADIASDNILPHKYWLKQILAPLVENKDIIASYPLRYTYRKDDNIFNRYVALFGVNDPIPFYLKKADRQSYLYSENDYKLSGQILSSRKLAQVSTHVPSELSRLKYWKIKFNTENLPTVGANGFIIRKKILQKAKVGPEKYFHIDVIYDLVKIGYNRFAVVNTGIIHNTADNLLSLLKKRSSYLSDLYLSQYNKRRYHIVTKKDYPKLVLFVLYSLTFIQPFFLSFQGFIKKRDFAWFIHPLFCFFITLTYGYAVIRYKLKQAINKFNFFQNVRIQKN